MPKPFDLFLVALSLSFLPYLVAESSSPAPSSQSPSSSPSSSSSCPPADEAHHFRLIQPRNGTLYQDFNQIKSTLLVDTTEITSPIEISLYRHVKCNECGYGISPELQHVGTLVHEELDGWLSYEWGTLGIGTYTMHVYLSSTSSTSSKPDVTQYRQCLSQVTSTFVIVNNQTLFETEDNRDDIQVYRWRLLKRWMWENGATHLHQLDIHIDPETGYRSIRTTQEIAANTTIITIPLRTVIQPVTFIHDTPFLRDVTTLLEYSRYDLYNMTDEQHTPAMVLFQIWCLAVGEECWWIHYIRSFPHHSFYMDSINTYRTTKSLPILTYQDYRQHAPPLPITWSDNEVDAWKEFSGYQTIVNVRNAQRAIIYNSTKYLTAPVITLLNLPRYNDTSTVYHPFTETLLMWSVVMRLSRAWNQQFYITPDYQWIPYNFTRGVKKDDQPTGAHMYPIMDLFDHDDIRGRPVLQDHSIQYLALYTPSAKQLSSGYKKGDIVYDSYKQEMAPITALLHYGWVLPETSHFLHLTLQSVAPENNGTTFTPADYARAASVETVLRYLNIPMHHPWQLGLSLQSLPHRLMLRARLLFYQFERDPENPISAEQLAHLLKQREYMILSPSTERLAHNFLRHAIWDNIRLPERENDTNTTDTIPAVASVSVDVTDEEKQKLIESSTTTTTSEESVTISSESSNTTSTKVPLTPDSILESIFANRNSTYHEYARASFILAERHVARHILKLIDQHEKMSQSMEFTPLNHVAPSTTNFTTCPPPKSRRTYRLRSRA